MTLNRSAVAPLLCVLSAVWALLPTPAHAQQLQRMEITPLAEGVYGAIYTEMISDPVQSNAMIIIGTDGVCVVDAHYTPSAARATIAEIKKLTSLPVRYVVTTHWHDDHIFGNQAYRDAYPGVEFVAQRETRTAMAARAEEHHQSLVTSYSAAVPNLEAALKSGTNRQGKPLSDQDRAEVTKLLPVYRAYLEDFKSVQVVMPTITFEDRLTLHLGAREIQARSFGRGNTQGDIVVFLPKEKIVAVGDLVVHPVPFIYGGFPEHWVEVLQAVKALAPEIIVPGHGPVMRDFSYIDRVSALLQSLASQARVAVAKGLSLEDARKAIDLTAFRDAFVKGHVSGDDTWTESIIDAGVKAAYDEAKAAAEKRKSYPS